jgi:hypothetical protein
VSRLPPRPRTRSRYDTKGFWLWDLLQSLGLIAVAYLVAVFVYLVLIRVSELPHGQLWDESFRAPLAFGLIVAATAVILLPYFQKEWDKGLRMFSIFTAVFLLGFASLSASGIVDPKLPLTLISRYAIEPLRHFLKF